MAGGQEDLAALLAARSASRYTQVTEAAVTVARTQIRMSRERAGKEK